MNDVLVRDAISWLPTLENKSCDLICSGLWANPSPEALRTLAKETVRLAKKAVVLLTVHQYDACDLMTRFRQAGYAPKFVHDVKIQGSKSSGNATQWGVWVPLPQMTTYRETLELPWGRPYDGFISTDGALTGNDITPCMQSRHRSNPEGTRQSAVRDWFPITVPRKSETPDQPSQPESMSYRFVMEWTQPSDIVLDFSCGSGTTLLVAKRLYRNFVGADLDPKKVKLATDRLEEVVPDSLREEYRKGLEAIVAPHRAFARWAPRRVDKKS